MEPCSRALRSAASRLVLGAGASVIDRSACAMQRRSVAHARLRLIATVRADDLMPRVDLRVLGGEVLREPLDQVDGAMRAAGAADGDRQIAAIGAAQLRDPVLE